MLNNYKYAVETGSYMRNYGNPDGVRGPAPAAASVECGIISGVVRLASSPLDALKRAIRTDPQLCEYLRCKHRSDYAIMRDRIILYDTDYYLLEDCFDNRVGVDILPHSVQVINRFYGWLNAHGIESEVDPADDGGEFHRTYLDDRLFMAGSGLTPQQLTMIKEYFANCKRFHPLVDALWDDLGENLNRLEDFLIEKLARIELNYVSVWLDF